MTHIVPAPCLLAFFGRLQTQQGSPLAPIAVHVVDIQCTGVKGVYDALQELLSTSMWQHVLSLTFLTCCLQALETRIQKNIAKKGDSIKLKPVSAQKLSAHKSHQSPTK